MDIIIDLSNTFKDSVINLIITTGNKRFDDKIEIVQIDDFSKLNKNLLKHNTLYIKDNYILISNTILKEIYNINGDNYNNCDKLPGLFSIINIQYKNLKWRNKNNMNLCYLERRIRDQNYQIINSIKGKNITCDYIIMVGRKYHNKVTDVRNNHCFGVFCIDKIEEQINQMEIDEIAIDIKQDQNNTDVDTESIIMIRSGAYRTKFLKQLKNYIYGDQKRNFYIKNEIRRSVFLDVEFINDIYDDFETFPVSKDLSILFMIGMYYYDKEQGDFVYKNLVTRSLDTQNEFEILENYLNTLQYISESNGGNKINIFHWSNADLWAINKALSKYPDLSDKTKENCVIYIDLLKIIKSVVKLESYSLKTVSKKLLEKHYHTECQNGLDAMMNMISSSNQDNQISEIEQHTDNDNKQLCDLIEYNRLDTTIMYDIVKEFCKI